MLGSSNYLGIEAFERFLWRIESLPDWVQKSIQTICLLVCVYSGRALFSIYCLWDNRGVMWHWVSIQLLPSLCDGHNPFYKLNADWCFQYRATDGRRFSVVVYMKTFPHGLGMLCYHPSTRNMKANPCFQFLKQTELLHTQRMSNWLYP